MTRSFPLGTFFSDDLQSSCDKKNSAGKERSHRYKKYDHTA